MVRNRFAETFWLYAISLVLLVWTLLPVVHLFVVSITPLDETYLGGLWPERPTLSNYKLVLTQDNYYLANLWRQFLNSLLIAVGTCGIVLLIASLVAFAVGRMKIRHGAAVTNAALLTYLIPAAFLAIPMFKVMSSYGLLDSIWSMILAQVAVTCPYAIWVLKQYSESVPLEIDEAARIDGATPFQIAWRIQIPLITPALVLTTVFSIIGTLQLFAEPQVLSKVAPAIDSQFTPNLSAFTTAFAYNDYNVAAAQAVLIAVVAFVLSFVFLRLTNREDS